MGFVKIYPLQDPQSKHLAIDYKFIINSAKRKPLKQIIELLLNNFILIVGKILLFVLGRCGFFEFW